MRNFQQRIAHDSTIIYDLRITASNSALFFIIKVDKHKHPLFTKAIEQPQGMLNLQDYGTILYRGFNQPCAATQQILAEQYGMYQSPASTS